MKSIFPILLACLAFIACNNEPGNKQENKEPAVARDSTAEPDFFFPVTDFLKGQVTEIRTKGINPKKIVVAGNKTDSSWVKMEDIDQEINVFLTPEIDRSNLTHLFTEKKFLDQTINTFTFTYDPIKALPDTFSLKRWDVYIDPETNKVKRIYLVKKLPGGKTQQLTWLAGKSCRMVTLTEKPDGTPIIEKEETLNWDF